MPYIADTFNDASDGRETDASPFFDFSLSFRAIVNVRPHPILLQRGWLYGWSESNARYERIGKAEAEPPASLSFSTRLHSPIPAPLVLDLARPHRAVVGAEPNPDVIEQDGWLYGWSESNVRYERIGMFVP